MISALLVVMNAFISNEEVNLPYLLLWNFSDSNMLFTTFECTVY